MRFRHDFLTFSKKQLMHAIKDFVVLMPEYLFLVVQSEKCALIIRKFTAYTCVHICKVIKLLSSAKWHRYSIYAGIFYSLSSRLISFSVAVRGDKTVLLDTGLELPQFAANGITRHHFFLTTLDFLASRAELLTLYQVLKTPLPARFSELGFYRTCKISLLPRFCSTSEPCLHK